ncbi:MAG: hypothetical protein ACR2LC_17005 [Pyrinomonadaceae bacterium]
MNLSKFLPFKPAPLSEVAKCFGAQLARVGIRYGEMIVLECTEDIKPGDFVIAQWQSLMILAEVRPHGWLRVDFAASEPPLFIPPGTARIRGRVGRAVNKLDVPRYLAPLN